MSVEKEIRQDRSIGFLLKKRERHGDVFTLRPPGGPPLLVVGDPALAKDVFNAPAGALNAGEGNRRVLGWLLGEHSLILLDGDRHMSHRRLLLPPLHGRRLERQAAAIRALAEAQLDAWPPEEAAALPRMRALTLDVVMRAAFGESEEGRLDLLREALRDLLSGGRHGAERESRETAGRADGLIDEEVAWRRRRLQPGDDVLSQLLEARFGDGSSLSDAEIRDELMTLIVAGTETTAASLAWALERLARVPEALAQAVADAEEGPGSYIDAVICETLRMRPAVPMSARLVKQPFRLGERLVPAETVIAVSALLIHHRADIYPEPAAFRPERFLGRPPGTYTWIPFGGGVRRCIGASFAMQEMRIVLSALLARMRLRVTEPEPEGIRRRANTLVPARGARVVLESRRKAL